MTDPPLAAVIRPSHVRSFLRDGRSPGTVHMWTLSHTTKIGHLGPADMTKQGFAEHVLVGHRLSDVGVAFYSVFREPHQRSAGDTAATWHYHMAVQAKARHRFRRIVAHLHSRGLYPNVMPATGLRAYWQCFAYCFAPSGLHKTIHDLDADPLLGPQHPAIPQDIQAKRTHAPRLRPSEVTRFVRDQGMRSVTELRAFAMREEREGRPALFDWIAQKGAALGAAFQAMRATIGAEQTLQHERATRVSVWRQAADADCVCNGTLPTALDYLCAQHELAADVFAGHLLDWLHFGTRQKASLILLWGVADSGKTTLCAPLERMFADRCFARPDQKATFPLQTLPRALIAIWQDFRLSESCVPWSTLLVWLEGQALSCDCPKTDSDRQAVVLDEPPPMFITSQDRIQRTLQVRGRGPIPDERENAAFAARVRFEFEFKEPLRVRNKNLKPALRCGGCYCRWVEANANRRLPRDEVCGSDPTRDRRLSATDDALHTQPDPEQERPPQEDAAEDWALSPRVVFPIAEDYIRQLPADKPTRLSDVLSTVESALAFRAQRGSKHRKVRAASWAGRSGPGAGGTVVDRPFGPRGGWARRVGLRVGGWPRAKCIGGRCPCKSRCSPLCSPGTQGDVP